ncbi:hypothetical protein N7468_007892 [Penicillium chermesinum]|uniref:Uncharacterized protein n=1 Tax=Penicillium chermesinum TaxID=63820 RepID=A0A9W9NNW8_9EURO|nr:uncharacterized protein N7468_007892 [Penicillium chermesinum]KAJ5223350.1 hypothetical protein N7468_007892 [Penicillium chermesinum]
MEGGHAWRSQWLRLLDPKPRGDESEMQRLNDTKIRTAEARKEAAQETMNVFVRSTAHHLICYRSLQPETEASLREIFINAAELSYKLWQRKSYLEFRGMKDLPRTFNNGVDILQPHRMHNVALGDDATALDGATVLMVTHPAVLVHGASDGSDYGRSGILKAAVVWVG